MDLSLIIPAREEPYLQQTVDSVLAAIEADTEIIVVCDGYVPDPPINQNPRVVLLYHPEARGQRASINEAAKIARGRFVMKLDAHCAVSPGFDRQLIADWQPGWTLVPLMFNLDIATFQPKMHKQTRAMFIGLNEKGELRAQYYSRQPRFDNPIHETMACMGCGWFLSKDDFWKQGGCDENHGGSAGWGAQSVEVSLKAWLSGGALMCDENAWFAHWFRGDQGFPYPISGKEVARVREYSKSLWLNDRWPGQARPLRWLVEKFQPPGWENHVWEEHSLLDYDEAKRDEMNAILGNRVGKYRTIYRGVPIVKMPADLMTYHRVLWETRPKWVVETGTKFGGSALWLQDQLDLIGEGGRVVTVDVDPRYIRRDERVTYLTGSSIDRAMAERVRAIIAEGGGGTVMVVLDSNHSRKHVKWELHFYAPLVTPGQYLVIEDCYSGGPQIGAGQARDWFLSDRRGRAFEQTNADVPYLVGFCIGGWLRRKT